MNAAKILGTSEVTGAAEVMDAARALETAWMTDETEVMGATEVMDAAKVESGCDGSPRETRGPRSDGDPTKSSKPGLMRHSLI